LTSSIKKYSAGNNAANPAKSSNADINTDIAIFKTPLLSLGNSKLYILLYIESYFKKIVSGAWGFPQQENARGPYGALLAKYVYLRRQENAPWSPSCTASQTISSNHERVKSLLILCCLIA
jgi:hypothetical protein